LATLVVTKVWITKKVVLAAGGWEYFWKDKQSTGNEADEKQFVVLQKKGREMECWRRERED
jgi:hypothetical protein